MIINKFIASKDHVIIYTRYTEEGDFFPYLESDHSNTLKTNSIGIFTTANSEHFYSNTYDTEGKPVWNKLQDVSGPLGAVYPIYDWNNINGFGTLVGGNSNTSQITVWTKEYMNASREITQEVESPKPLRCIESSAEKNQQESAVDDIIQDGDFSNELVEESVVVGKYQMEDSSYHYEHISNTSSVSEESLGIDWTNWED